jgi:hypothetical protein
MIVGSHITPFPRSLPSSEPILIPSPHTFGDKPPCEWFRHLTVAENVAGAGLDGLVPRSSDADKTPESIGLCNPIQTRLNHPARSAKPLCVGSIPTRASKFLNNIAGNMNDSRR